MTDPDRDRKVEVARNLEKPSRIVFGKSETLHRHRNKVSRQMGNADGVEAVSHECECDRDLQCEDERGSGYGRPFASRRERGEKEKRRRP